MKGSPTAPAAKGTRWRDGIVGWTGVALVLWVGGSGKSLAESPFRPPFVAGAPARAETIRLAQPAAPASQEIWISSEAPAEPAAPVGPAPAYAGSVRSAQASRLAEVTSPHQAPDSSGGSHPGTPSMLIARLKAAQRELIEDVRPGRGAAAPRGREDDCLLFHTTTGPEKPAALVFRPVPQTEGDQAAPALPQGNPDVSARVSEPSEAVLAGHPARRIHADSEAVAEKVFLRVCVAEFDRAGARKWGILRWKLSRRPPLLVSLLEADSGVHPILLASAERDEIESQIGRLEHDGVLRVRGQPTLVTASGREATLLSEMARLRLASGRESAPLPAGGPAPSGLTLRPVVIRGDQIELKVTGPRSDAGPPKSHDKTDARAAQTGSATVRMRAGQTVAIRGLGHVEPAGEEPAKRTPLANVLGLGKAGPKPGELVLFITPELVGSTPPVKAASWTRDDPAHGQEPSSRW